MKLFLTAKHWQVFLLLVGSMVGGALLQPASLDPLLGMVVSTLLFMGVWMLWLWSIAAGANEKLDVSLRKSTRLMVLGVGFAAFYLAVSPFIWPDSEGNPGIPSLMVPMHLLAMAGIFYALLFTANRLVTLERRQKVSFFDYSGPFFLIWFFPLGVWFVQPRVNRLLGNNNA